jgi:hypothetical protein
MLLTDVAAVLLWWLGLSVQVIVGNMPWRFGAYLSYCERGAELDEMPLYLFDKVRQ